MIGTSPGFTLRLLGHRFLEGRFGVTTLCRFADGAGNRLVWFATGHCSFVQGGTYALDATVKAHEEYEGVRQTVLTRVAVADPST